MDSELKFKNKDNKRLLKKMINNTNIRCYYTNNESDYIQFHNILVENLRKNHNTNPTHTKDELLSIKSILNEYINYSQNINTTFENNNYDQYIDSMSENSLDLNDIENIIFYDLKF